MSFLIENNLLIDSITRKLLSHSICDLNKYIKIDNALMKLSISNIPIEEINFVIEKLPKYKSLNDFFMKKFPEVFILKCTNRLSSKDDSMHRIILKDEKKLINE